MLYSKVGAKAECGREEELIKRSGSDLKDVGLRGLLRSSEQQRASGMTRRLEGWTVPYRRPDGVRPSSLETKEIVYPSCDLSPYDLSGWILIILVPVIFLPEFQLLSRD